MRDPRRLRIRMALFITAVLMTSSVSDMRSASAHNGTLRSAAIAERRALRNHLFDKSHVGPQSGIASTYSGGKTASGQPMNSGELTAAHRSLPFGTKIKVTNRHTGRSVVVRINDRGPFVKGRVIDLSPAAARAI
jgi:rare lipoprotein A